MMKDTTRLLIEEVSKEYLEIKKQTEKQLYDEEHWVRQVQIVTEKIKQKEESKKAYHRYVEATNYYNKKYDPRVRTKPIEHDLDGLEIYSLE